jgi:uncharacterized coiled-coil protein SlyX
MQLAAVFLLALASSPLGAAGAGAHPIEKVIVMLQGLTTTAELEGKTEALSYEKYDYWCKNSLKELQAAIADETEAIASLEDKIASGEQQAATLNDELAALAAQLAELDASAMKAKQDRADTAATYAETFKDLTETKDAIHAAIKELEGARDAGEKDAEFLQVVNKAVVQKALMIAQAAAPDAAKASAISALLQREDPDYKERPDFEAEGDRAKHVQKYNFKSGDIIETLKTLKLKFEDEITATTKAETASINAYDLSKQARDEVIFQSGASVKAKKAVLADVMGDLATNNAELKSEKADKATDEATLASTEKACMVKKQEWDDRSAVRSAEIEALEAAINILATATGVQTKAPENPIPPPSPAAHEPIFLQIEDPRMKALNLLRATAKKTHSHSMERLVQQLSTHLDDPFQDVSNMIEKMIFHLMDEQRQEDEHKDWCDQELAHNNASKIDKEDKIDDLSNKIATADAFVVKLTSEIADANSKIAAIVAFMAEATEIRGIGKKENAVAIEDAQQAQTAIADASAVIEAFYKESGMVAKEPWEALVQQPVALSDQPSTWKSSYSGVADPVAGQPKGILTVLQKVASDFATMEADTRAQEATDQAQYEEQIKENKISQAEREQEVQTKSSEKGRQVEIIASLTAAKKHTSDELETVEQYLHDLIPACVAGDSTYEERKAARGEETAALQKAQVILAEAFNAAPAPAPAAAGKFLASVHKHSA